MAETTKWVDDGWVDGGGRRKVEGGRAQSSVSSVPACVAAGLDGMEDVNGRWRMRMYGRNCERPFARTGQDRTGLD
jgi:hypothetical protein